MSITAAPSIGPVLGGSLAYAGNWTWIFWFLSIAAGVCLILMIFFLPETSRNVVGNGSIKPPMLLRLPVGTRMRHSRDGEVSSRRGWRAPNPLKSLRILGRKDNAIIIVAAGLLYVIYTCICASLSTICIEIYKLNQWQAGLIYLPFGVGGALNTFFFGKVMDTAYHNARSKRGLPTDKLCGDELDSFPIEKARLVVMWVPILLIATAVLAYGWALQYHQVSVCHIQDVVSG